MTDIKVTDPITGVEHVIGNVIPFVDAKTEEKVEEIKKTETRTQHMIHGVKVYITDEEKAVVDKLTAEMNKVLNDRPLSQVSISDKYYELKKDLEKFVGNLRQ